MLCGKIIYRTRAEATESLKGAHKDRRKWRRMATTETYWCKDCNAWHTTSGTNSIKRKRHKFKERKAKDEKLFHVQRQVTKNHILHIHTPKTFKIK